MNMRASPNNSEGSGEDAGNGREADALKSLGSLHFEPWLEALQHVAQHYRLPVSVERVRHAAEWDVLSDEPEMIRNIARQMGLQVKFGNAGATRLSSWNLPIVLQLADGRIGVLTALGKDTASLAFSGDRGLETPVPLEALAGKVETLLIPRPARAVPDQRVDAYIKPYEKNWLRQIVLRDLKPYGHVLLASLVANVLGMAGILFSMQVYDRVVPAQSYPTLYVLFSGVLLAILFDFLMRRVRTSVVDLLGKRADLRMSDRVFGHALRVKNSARPASTGTFIAQLRDLEQVRELLTSTTVAAIADLPFVLLFLVLFWYIGGIIVLVPIAAILAMLIPGILAQRKIRIHASEAMRESSLRNAMLVEAVQGIEDIKTLQAEERFQQQWNHYNLVTGEAQMRGRDLANTLNTWTSSVQTAVYAVVIFVGAPMVIAGDMTTGALVGASMLGSRMIAPMAQIAQVLTRLQHAKVAMKSLNELMGLPVDHPDAESRVHLGQIPGNYRLKSAVFRYGPEGLPALTVRDLSIKAGEHIAILGKNGAGKSTLLQALSGLLESSSGEVLLENVSLPQIDPADVRRDVGLITQNARLFFGTIRENITLGAPHASAQEIMGALSMVGADEFIRKLPKGLEHVLLEGGIGLSGGQRQALLLARLIIRQPNVILLDEPTASMDEATERNFIRQFREWSTGRTVVIATHRMRVLDVAERMIVVENGTITLDDNKENAMRRMAGASVQKPAVTKIQPNDPTQAATTPASSTPNPAPTEEPSAPPAAEPAAPPERQATTAKRSRKSSNET
ncbi:ATP-binding cassette subfamily C protein LapB [Neorhizobium huautlense]|uniref:ATP-binding cassette subfamily C protein LapB n=1 Tax=Neorhizobium huautlense TaxID=67774 RepID=A0ABT9PR15_9HYPH|nr:type I secretion system permease/ATPase [Neorhizobium huautlense]MDP9836908.1 ATP-binding cassette subfamily C protein LapB [Neorhizobium huautlense]